MIDLGIVRYRLLKVWARRWQVPGAWILGEALDHTESWLCRRYDIHTGRCGRGSLRHPWPIDHR